MSRKFPHALAALIFIFGIVMAGKAYATTYYIASSGSDSNNGTSKSTPWAHLPGMATWTGTHTPAAGDTFILRGCDVWGNSNFPINWTWSGTSSSPITVGGEDQTWYNTATCPTAWNRPVFDAQGTEIAAATWPTSGNNMFVAGGETSYQVWDWIEARGLNWSHSQINWQSGPSCGVWNGSNITIDHWYVHGWTHTGGVATDDFTCFSGSTTTPFNGSSVIENTVFDGSDSTNGGDSGRFIYVWPNVTFNVIHDAPNAVYGPLGSQSDHEISNNRIYNIKNSFDGTVHENVIEVLNPSTGTFYIHDNVLGPNTSGEGLMIGNAGETDYVWNNVWYGPWNPPQMPQNGIAGYAQYFWNNTIVPSNTLNPTSGRGNTTCLIYGTVSPQWNTIVMQNNYCISDVGFSNITPPATNLTMDHNITVGSVAAASQGYVVSSTFAYSSQTVNCNGISANCPIGAGANLTSQATGLVAGMLNDTTYACSQQTVNGVVEAVCPARVTVPRPPTGAWDVGAYEFSAGVPNPPTGLAASVQ